MLRPGPPGAYTHGLSVALRRSGSAVKYRLVNGTRCGRYGFPNLFLAGSAHVGRGAFANSGARTMPHTRGRLRMRYSIRGRFTPAGARGTVALSGTYSTGARTYRCQPFRAPFDVRRRAHPSGSPAVATLGVAYHGLSGQRVTGIGAPVSLSVDRGSMRVAAEWVARTRCARNVDGFQNLTPLTPIGRDGRFRRSERFTQHYIDADVEYHMTFSGQFLADGARGTLRAMAIERDRRTHRIRSRCDSGVVRWTAVR